MWAWLGTKGEHAELEEKGLLGEGSASQKPIKWCATRESLSEGQGRVGDRAEREAPRLVRTFPPFH